MFRKVFLSISALMLLLPLACNKPQVPNQNTDNNGGTDTPPENYNPIVPQEQYKYYLTAAEDLEGKVSDKTAGLKILLQDSKFYAVGERVLSVTYEADKDIADLVEGDVISGKSKSVSMSWKSQDPINRPAVMHAPDAAEFGILCFPGEYSGKFTVKTSRYTYTFTKSVTAAAGTTVTVPLDFAAPDEQPTRKVGVMGDSISTFDGTMCNPDYSAFYPAKDPNVTSNPENAVNSKERTYWWRLIYDKMKHGELDVNSSWSGTRVVHEIKNGRQSGKSQGAGFVDRAYDFVNPDIILIHGGTNDSNQSTPLGTYDWDLPIGQLDVTLYRSAFIQLIKMLQNRYEGVQIIIIIGDRLTTDYASANKEVAEHFGLPYVNFVGDSIEKCSGSHPTSNAFEQMASKIYSTCKDYLP